MPFDFFFFSHLFMTLIVEDRCYSKENSCKQNDVYFKLGKNRIQDSNMSFLINRFICFKIIWVFHCKFNVL